MVLIDLSKIDEKGLDPIGKLWVLGDGQKTSDIIAVRKCTEY